MRRLLTAAAFCLLAGSAAAQGTPSGTLHIALREDADMLDPTLARTYVGRIVFAGLCDKLFDIDQKLAIVPQLAAGYEWSDPKTLVVHLRPNVQFQDGEAMDATAVKYSIDRHMTMQGSFRRPEISTLDHVEIVDPLTVRLVLKSPSSPFLSQLTDRAGMIVAPKAAETAGKDFALHPVCAGPFKFVERVPQDRIVLERFPEYWDAENIHFDRVIYQPMADTSVRLANLQAGSVDLVEQIVPSDVAAVKRDSRLKLAISNALGYYGITNNVGNGARAETPFGRDKRVRQAFELAIDRTALVQVVYNGMFLPTRQAVPPDSPFYVPQDQPPPRDVARAKALLQQAGATLPVAVDLLTPNSPDVRQAAEVIQSMAAEAGFDVHINTMEFASSLDTAQNGNFQAYLLAWSGRADADGNLYSFLYTGQAQNYSHYSDKTVDALLDQSRAVADVGQRRDLYAKMDAQADQDLPIIYLWTPKNIVGMTAKLQGFRPVPDGMIRLQGLAMAK
ncbi:MAG: ABC transporter substrate-binding protein [Acidisphaera sp.]|nr:ABC transporter substrate-binding protein [Acidisphaera sp.]